MQHSDHEPAFPISVPDEFYWAVEAECGGEFADSYLFGGTVSGGKFVPRTLTGWEKLVDSFGFEKALNAAKLTMVKPPIYTGMPAWKLLGLPDPKNPNGAKGKKRGGWE